VIGEGEEPSRSNDAAGARNPIARIDIAVGSRFLTA